MGSAQLAATNGVGSGVGYRGLLGLWWSGQVGLGDWLIAVRAGAARANAAGEEVAVGAAALVEVAGFALGAFVDDAGSGVGARAHRVPPKGVTPSPARAWDRRTDSPLV